MGPLEPVNARGVRATRMVAGGNMREPTAISRTHHLVLESHHLARNRFSPRSPQLQLRTPINLNRTDVFVKRRRTLRVTQ